MPHLGLGGLDELSADRRIEKQIANFDSSANAATAGCDRFALPTVYAKFEASVGVSGSATNAHLADLGDRGQGFAAEAQRVDPKEIVGVTDFAGRMTGNGKFQLIMCDPVAVIGNAHHLHTTLRY